VQLLEDVYQHYPATRASGRCEPATPFTPDRAALRDGLPNLIKDLVTSSGRNLSDFTVYGRAGEMNRNFPKIPWVAVCYGEITKSTKRGYYIVLLFHERTEGCFLSLNQGYTQFADSFPTADLALLQIEQSASRCLGYLEPKRGYVEGPIDLAATGDLGIGYERGAIISKWYPRDANVTEAGFGTDLEYLLDQYERLITFMGLKLPLNLLLSEGALQAAASSLADSRLGWRDPPPGPIPISPPVAGSKSTRWPRDPKISARVQQLARFQCEVDGTHSTFPRRKSGQNFVESHHLVPMGLQGQFSVSLDVVENVVALCPICHRLLHHGRRGPKGPILNKLFQNRRAGLRTRGIDIEFDGLLRAYATDLGGEED
jgi:5-methylcytosine-specific restriction protein A